MAQSRTPIPHVSISPPDLPQMAHVSPALASVFFDRGAAALWSKLKDDDPLSRLCSKYWGEIIEDEAEQWRRSHSTVDDPTNDIGPGCYVLDLGIKFLYPSKLWVRQDYIRIYDYCREEAPTATEDSRSVVITGQPGIGMFKFPFFIGSCTLSNNPSREKVNHSGRPTPSVVVSVNKSHFSGIKIVTATYLSRMECINDPSRMSGAVILCRSCCGPLLMRMNANLVFPEISLIIARTSISCSSLSRSDSDGSVWRSIRIIWRSS